jgi:hypothetical protein
MNPAAKKRLLVVGGVVVLGGVAYYLWQKSQEAPPPAPLPSGGGGGALPKPAPLPSTGPSAATIQAYKDAQTMWDRFATYIQQNVPTTQAELDAALAKRTELANALRAAAAKAGVTVNV